MTTPASDDLEAPDERTPLMPKTKSLQSRASDATSHSDDDSEIYEDPDSMALPDVLEALEAIEKNLEKKADGTDVVQLSAPMYYTCENDNFVQVEVTRLGSLKGVASVLFRTSNGSARAGINYKKYVGRIFFKSGEHTKALDIPILQDGVWTPSTEFVLHLDHARDCLLGVHLQTARVKIMNDDTFPSDDYRDVVQSGDDAVRNINKWSLYRRYLAFNFRCGGVKQQSILCMCLDQMSNVCLFVQLCVVVYLVDVVFDRGQQTRDHLLLKDRYHNTILVGLWYVVPVLFLFMWDAYKVGLDIEGTTRSFLQRSMMKTFLNYTEKSRKRVTLSDLDIAISSSSSAVARGYTAGLNILQNMGKILAVLLFICLYRPQIQAVCVVALMPILLLWFTAVRVRPTEEAEIDVALKTRKQMTLAHEACNQFRLIADYFKRYIFSDMFSKAIDEHKEAVKEQTSIRLITVYVTKFMSGFFICVYVITNAQAVLNGQLSLGLFLATINIFGTYMADAITELNNNLETIIESFASLEEFTIQFNLPFELISMKKLSGLRQERTSKLRKSLFANFTPRHSGGSVSAPDVGVEGSATGFADGMEIRLENVSFSHYDRRLKKDDVKFQNLNISTPQGTMVAVTGCHASFKRTLLEMLADISLPSSGFVFIPSHLRVLHVSRQLFFMNMSLLDNLTLGLPQRQPIDVDRIKAILRLMKLPEFCIEEVDREFHDTIASTSASKEDEHTPVRKNNPFSAWTTPRNRKSQKAQKWNLSHAAALDWPHMLSHTQCAMLHLCRALIANPNVLILQRPVHHFSEEVAIEVMKLFRMHVELRGLGYVAETASMRRPRTVFAIVETKAQANVADAIWSVNPEAKSVDVSFPSKGWLG